MKLESCVKDEYKSRNPAILCGAFFYSSTFSVFVLILAESSDNPSDYPS